MSSGKDCTPDSQVYAEGHKHFFIVTALQGHFTLMWKSSVKFDLLSTVDLSLPMVWAMAVFVEPFVMPARMIRRSSKVK